MNPLVFSVGDDVDFHRELHAVLSASGIQARSMPYSESVLADAASEEALGLLIVDFTGLSNPLPPVLCRQLMLLRRSSAHALVPFAAVFADRAQRDALAHVHLLGFCLSYVKGGDTQLFLRDCIWLVNGEGRHLGEFATVRDLHLPYFLEGQAAVVEIESDRLCLDADVEDPPAAGVRFAAFGEQCPVGWRRQKEAVGVGRWHDTLHSLELELDYPGAWDEPNPHALLRDTLETWLANNVGEPRTPAALFLGGGVGLLRCLMENTEQEGVRLYTASSWEEMLARTRALSPDLLFVETDGDGDSIWEVLGRELVQRPDWRPFIFLFRSAIPIEEARRLLGAERVWTLEQQLSWETVAPLLATYTRKHPSSSEGGSPRRLPLHDPDRLMRLRMPIIVTGLSEHEMTFLSSHELPLFTVLWLDRPVSCPVLVVPEFRELHRHPAGKHYQGILHGLDLEQGNALRAYVNAAIFHRPTEFGATIPHEIPEAALAQCAEAIPPKDHPMPALATPLPRKRRGGGAKSKL